jgi:hypothetical protein
VLPHRRNKGYRGLSQLSSRRNAEALRMPFPMPPGPNPASLYSPGGHP